HPRNVKARLLLYVFTVQLAYSVFVGGDAWEFYGGTNRYVTSVMPFFFILLSLAIYKTIVQLARKFYPEKSKQLFVVCIIFVLLAIHCFNRPLIKELLLLEFPLHVHDNVLMIWYSQFINDVTYPNATILVVHAGVPPYFTDRYFIDLLGKNDNVIARRNAVLAGWTQFYPGHNKWDYNYSIITLEPDVILNLWSKEDALKIKPYLEENYIQFFTVFLRKDSQNIDYKRFYEGPFTFPMIVENTFI
ncbi:MAG: hypothetical protein ABH851_05060, partial [Methanobacteriota archaeon]